MSAIGEASVAWKDCALTMLQGSNFVRQEKKQGEVRETRIHTHTHQKQPHCGADAQGTTRAWSARSAAAGPSDRWTLSGDCVGGVRGPLRVGPARLTCAGSPLRDGNRLAGLDFHFQT